MSDDFELDMVPQTLGGQFFINSKEYTLTDFLAGAGELLANLRETKNWQMLSDTVRSLAGFSQASGKTLAVLVHGGLSIWKETGGAESDYFTMLTNQSNVQRVTLERYCLAMEGMEYVPEELKDKVMAQPVKNLILLGSAVDKGYIPDKEGWKKVADAGDYPTLNMILHEETDMPARSNNLRICMESSGDLYAYVNEQRIFIGYLDLADDESDKDKHRALSRVIKSAGIIDGRKS